MSHALDSSRTLHPHRARTYRHFQHDPVVQSRRKACWLHVTGCGKLAPPELVLFFNNLATRWPDRRNIALRAGSSDKAVLESVYWTGRILQHVARVFDQIT